VIGQCSRFIRALPSARVETATSTAEAVRRVAEEPKRPWAALGNRLSAEIYRCRILREGIEDHPDNETRFVWLAPRGRPGGVGEGAAGRGWKTSIVFWGVGAEAPGWLVRCLSEFASRAVNLTRIESRPRGLGLGRYMFFADLEGRDRDAGVVEGIAGLRSHCDDVRILGSYPAA
jgi:prephenate dehydratase